MAITISLYNHTARRFADGSNAVGDTYKVKLLSANAGGFNATHTTLAGVGGTEVSNAGYTAGGATLANVTVTTTTTNDATFDADDATWTATSAALSAIAAVIYNDTGANDPPLAYVDFGGTQTAQDTAQFKIVWNASGIFTFTVA
jgi:hypothetical protein